MKKILGFLGILLFSGAVAFMVSSVMLSTPETPQQPVTGQQLATQSNPSSTIPDISQKLIPSVVGISSNITEHSFKSPTYSEAMSMGSGVIVSENGFILTNHHVIANANKIQVTLHDGKSLNAVTIWSDEFLDLAVIRIPATSLPFATLGDSSSLLVGESVIAIGNPLSLQFQRTVTAGIISALDRVISLTAKDGSEYFMENLIQTDASINPGNSGGPLINTNGEVIGINTVKVSSAEGIGFAIPINLCRPIISQIISNGTFKTPYLGLYAYDRQTALYITGDFGGDSGIYVAEIDKNGPAYAAGMQAGDIITHVGTAKITSMLSLREQLFSYRPGDTVEISVLRDGRKIVFSSVVLGS